MRPAPAGASVAGRCRGRPPHGASRTPGRGLWARTAPPASNTGSGLITMPGPPPNGTSSTCRWRSWVCSRRSCVWSSMIPRSMPRPTTPCSNTGPNMAGKIVTTSNLMVWLRFLDLEQPIGDDHAPCFEAHLQHRVARGWNQVLDLAVAAHPHVVGGPLEDFGNSAQLPARTGLDRQPDHLMVVEVTVVQRPGGAVGDLEVPAAEQFREGAVVDASQLDDQAGGLPGAAPLNQSFAAVEHYRSARTEPILKVCQGNHLDGSIDPVRSRHLSDADHVGEPPPCCRRSRGEECASDGLARSTKTRLRSRSDATRTRVRSASMLRPALPMKRPTSASASLTLMATVPPPRSNASTSTSSGFSARERATYSTSAR